MTLIRRALRRLHIEQRAVLTDTRGLSTVEYVIILVVIAVVAIGTWQTFGSSVKARVGESTTAIDGLKVDTGSGTGTGSGTNSKAGTP